MTLEQDTIWTKEGNESAYKKRMTVFLGISIVVTAACTEPADIPVTGNRRRHHH